MQFKQLDFKLNKKTFEIERDGLRVTSSSISKHSEDFFEFEIIGDVLTTEKKRLVIPLIISILFFGLSTLLFIGAINGGKMGFGAVAFYYFIAFLFLAIFFFFGKNNLYLSKKDRSSHIEFLNNNPSKKKLLDFIDQLQQIKKEYLIGKYGTFNEVKSYHEHRQQLKWLFDNAIISIDEFNSKLKLIDEGFNSVQSDSPNTSIGFLKKSEGNT